MGDESVFIGKVWISWRPHHVNK